MTIEFEGLNTARINCFMGLDQGVNICLSLYQNITVLSVLLSLEADYFCLTIPEKKIFICSRIVLAWPAVVQLLVFIYSGIQ